MPGLSAYSPSFDFDSLTPMEVPVAYKGRTFLLLEADSEQATRWRSAVVASLRPHGEEMVPTATTPDTELLLVSMCLVEVTSKGHKPVSLGELRTWPNRAVKPLFLKAKKISSLDSEEKEPFGLAELKALRDEVDRRIARLEEAEATPEGEEPPAPLPE